MVPYVPTPIRTRPFHILQQLCREGHHLTLATLYSDTNEEQSLARWRAVGVDVLAASLTRQRSIWNAASVAPITVPLQAAFCWQPDLMRQIIQAMDRTTFDVVHIEHLRGSWYGIAAQEHLQRTNRETPVVWDSVDCITHLFAQASRNSVRRVSRFMTRLELRRTRDYEKKLAKRFARTLVVSERERTAFCEILASDCSRVTVVPNGVDLETFAPSKNPREPATILLTGKMSYHANVTAAFYLLDEIMPRVWQAIPQVRVCIAGQNPPAALKQRANAQVEITGTVPAMREYLNRATVACAPIRYGVGTQNKVLEAMACGTAVVATPPAVEALTAQPNEDLLIGRDAQECATQIISVLTDEALRLRLEKNGRRYVETNHQWANCTRTLVETYANAMLDSTRRGDVQDYVHT